MRPIVIGIAPCCFSMIPKINSCPAVNTSISWYRSLVREWSGQDRFTFSTFVELFLTLWDDSYMLPVLSRCCSNRHTIACHRLAKGQINHFIHLCVGVCWIFILAVNFSLRTCIKITKIIAWFEENAHSSLTTLFTSSATMHRASLLIWWPLLSFIEDALHIQHLFIDMIGVPWFSFACIPQGFCSSKPLEEHSLWPLK